MSVAADNVSDNGHCEWTKTTTMLACQTVLTLMARVNDSRGRQRVESARLIFLIAAVTYARGVLFPGRRSFSPPWWP